jgi:hypothetical protein
MPWQAPWVHMRVARSDAESAYKLRAPHRHRGLCHHEPGAHAYLGDALHDSRVESEPGICQSLWRQRARDVARNDGRPRIDLRPTQRTRAMSCYGTAARLGNDMHARRAMGRNASTPPGLLPRPLTWPTLVTTDSVG